MDIPETPGPTSYARTLTRTIEKPRIDTAFGHRSGRVTYDINDVIPASLIETKFHVYWL